MQTPRPPRGTHSFLSGWPLGTCHREHVSRFWVLRGLGVGGAPALCAHPCSTWQAGR